MTKIKLAWNGCNSYIESDKSVFTQREEFKPFEAVEIDINTLPVDEDGEINMDGVLGCENGKYYRAS
jgi:hypothetical protein